MSYIERLEDGSADVIDMLQAAAKIKQLKEEGERFYEVIFMVLGGSLDQAAAYGPDFEPPTADQVESACLRFIVVFKNET